VYALGDAFLAADLASQVGRRTAGHLVDYRLAPSTRIRQRSTTLLQPTKPSAKRHSLDIAFVGGRWRRSPSPPCQRPRSRAPPASCRLRHVAVCRSAWAGRPRELTRSTCAAGKTQPLV
jgi:hypothetical protein